MLKIRRGTQLQEGLCMSCGVVHQHGLTNAISVKDWTVKFCDVCLRTVVLELQNEGFSLGGKRTRLG